MSPHNVTYATRAQCLFDLRFVSPEPRVTVPALPFLSTFSPLMAAAFPFAISSLFPELLYFAFTKGSDCLTALPSSSATTNPAPALSRKMSSG